MLKIICNHQLRPSILEADFNPTGRIATSLTKEPVISESRKRRVFVGTLKWDISKNIFEFKYNQ